ncbi:MAG: hypothetical protein ACOVNU_04105 [Candidatus Kapaibacteriota bacterium]
MEQQTLEEVELAILFHNIYERLAPSFGYQTRLDTKSFETNTPNGILMIAVCKEIIKWQEQKMHKQLQEMYLKGIENYDTTFKKQ